MRAGFPAMALTILTVLCLFGCGFMLYVLLHWIREARTTSNRSGVEGQREQKQPNLVRSKAANIHRGKHPDSKAITLPNLSSFRCSERVAHQRIARSIISRKRA
jgi:hypothetical protein